MKMITLHNINQKNEMETGCSDENRPKQMMHFRTQIAMMENNRLQVAKAALSVLLWVRIV